MRDTDTSDTSAGDIAVLTLQLEMDFELVGVDLTSIAWAAT